MFDLTLNVNAGSEEGYKTGYQYDRFETEEEALSYIFGLVEKEDSEWCNVEVIDWEVAKPVHYLQYKDLPRLYPEKKSYSISNDAKEDGWYFVPKSKYLFQYKGYVLVNKDMSEIGMFGYDFGLHIRHESDYQFDDIVLGKSSEVYYENVENSHCGLVAVLYRSGDIRDAIDEMIKLIDSLSS